MTAGATAAGAPARVDVRGGAASRRTILRCLPALLWASVAAAQARPAPPAGAESLRDSARARLSQRDGTIAVAGLDSAVEVRRDRWGVPHIYARTAHDLFFAQGLVAAQDRLWQMDMWRRIGEGRLAEVLGPSMVERDRFARLLRYRGDLDAEFASYAPDARPIVRAFVDGVNAWIAAARDRPPIEYTLLGFRPEPFAEDVPINRMAALAMTGNALDEIAMARLVRRLGPARAAALRPLEPWRALDPARGLDLGGIDFDVLGAAAEAYGPVRYAREGSNNWVVSGAKTASGKPLLASDPHRALGVPSLRYLTHLVGPGWNVIGAGEPAQPGVAAGHNERVGFGFTIVGMDQQDVYVETVRACDTGRCYLNHGEWKPVRAVTDTIPVRGEAPRVVRLEFTEHGPIVGEDTTRHRAFAIRFVGSEPGTAGYLASLSVDRATDWASFQRAGARWKLPTENLIYADVDGHIGWVAAGLMPVRSWTGVLPVPGDGRFEWRGFLRFEELPQALDPAAGFIATANNNILPAGYTRPLAYDWAPPFRAERLAAVLRAGSRLTVSDFQRLQHDEFSIPAARTVPLLLAAAARRDLLGRPELQRLSRWNLVMSRDAVAPAIWESWQRAMIHRLSRIRLGPAADSLAPGEGELGVVEAIRLFTAPDAALGANPAATRDSIALLALDDATRELTAARGADREAWTWGSLHQAPFRHPLHGAFDLPAAPRGGDANTVNATAGPGWLQTSGASFREVLDFADWDNSVATSVPGQSGQPESDDYGRLLPMWREGEYFPLVFSRERVVRETIHLLMLTPAPAGGR